MLLISLFPRQLQPGLPRYRGVGRFLWTSIPAGVLIAGGESIGVKKYPTEVYTVIARFLISKRKLESIKAIRPSRS